jgi:hypothetical protein
LAKRCRFSKGIFVNFGQKIACATHVGPLPFLQTAQLDGMGWIKNF